MRKISENEVKFVPVSKQEAGVFDDILSCIGEFGRYQRRIYFLLCLPTISCALHKLSWVFLGPSADHRCLLPFEDPSNTTFLLGEHVMNMSLPRSGSGWSQCHRLDTNFSEEYFQSAVPASDIVPCQSWVFDTSQYASSAVYEFGLVCDLGWAKAAANTLMMFGDLMGAIIFGDMSDRFGRLPVFYFALVAQLFSGVLTWFAPTFITLVLARLVLGATVPGVYIVGYVLGIEMVGASKRQYAGVLMQMFFSIGYMLTAAFAYLVHDWRNLQLALTLPGLCFVVYCWIIPESPRWLLSRGYIKEATSILQQAAQENNSDISGGELETLISKIAENVRTDQETKQNQSTLYDIVKYPNLRNNAAIIFLVWFVNSLAYYGLSWNTGNLSGNDYVNFVISGAVEIPAYLFAMFAVSWLGRKPVLCGTMLAGSVALILTVIVPDELPWLLTLLAMLGKMAITSAFGASYVLSAEIFPTCVRNAGLGAASTLAGVGGMLAPFLILLSDYWTQLPFMVLGCTSLVTGLIALRLPETLNHDLPESIEDSEIFAKYT